MCVLCSLLCWATCVTPASAQDQPAQIWHEYVQAKQAGTTPPLPDFSYAGYRAGDEAIPDVEGPVFDVTAFGAKPDDGADDQDAIQRAIDAAERAGGGVVFIPAGTYHVNTDLTHRRPLRIRRSNIVLRGAGMGAGGTVILIEQPTFKLRQDDPDHGMGLGWLQIGPEEPRPGDLLDEPARTSNIVADAPRDSHIIAVDDSSWIRPGMWVSISISSSKQLSRQIIQPYKLDELPDGWTRIRDGAYRIEHHQVQSVDGSIITLREPLLTHVDASFGWTLIAYTPLENIGIEDICFQGGWLGKYNHHRSHMDDNGWEAIKFTRCADSWIRRCAIVNFSTCLSLESCAYMTVLHNVLAGQMGHVSIGNPRRSTNLLVALSTDTMQRNGSHNTTHGIGSAGSGAGIVYWRYQMAREQSFDFHGMWPYATLFDLVVGGDLNDSGGPIASFPNHAEFFVAWNFKHTYEPRYRNKKDYSFWGGSPRPSMVKPIFVGLHGVEVKLDEKTLGRNESFGDAVSPESLWEAQIALRHGGSPPAWIEQAKRQWSEMNREPAPYPRGDQNTPWVAQRRTQTIALIISTPMVKDRYDPDDPLQFLVDEWPTADGSPWPPMIHVTDGVVRLVAGKGEAIHYTTDGTEPDANSPRYTAPFERRSGTVNAIAVKQGHRPSFVASADLADGSVAVNP